MRPIIICLLCALATPTLSQSALRADYKGLNFTSMDADSDGVITRPEWISWFSDDIDARTWRPESVERPSTRVIRTGEGETVVTPNAIPMNLGSVDSTFSDTDLSPEDVEGRRLKNAQRAVQDSIFAYEGPISERNRLRTYNGRSITYMPEFDEFDTNGNGRIERTEISRVVPKAPSFPKSMPRGVIAIQN
jgi:hypothetical protein